MADNDERFENEGSGGGFMLGLLTGTVLGAGLGMLLAPKSGSDLRGAIGEQAKQIGNKATEQYRKATDSAGTWAEKGREKGREYADKARDAVSRGVDEARTYVAPGSGNGPAAPGSDFGRQ